MYFSELKIGNKFCKLVSLYRSPSQFQGEFETFKSFETNPFLVIALGDFNSKLSQWYKIIIQQLKFPK